MFAPLAQAQSNGGELSVEEITEAFKKQKTRGLVIVPSSTDQTQDTAQETATVAAAAEEYNPVDQQAQINVQISFDFDSAALRADQAPKLANMCESMKLMDGTVFQIIGHTDSSGSAAYNERLSLLRAQEVRRHLISACGVPEDMLKAIGMGETAPFNQDNPRADENRRVEFQALG
ncbi:OmpA family protein (plasmid) [Leisingera aquaemixtae]|jgi:outer membrane protein OmpA-like peptidoglycan-associated protein|uniref:OmpA family protein n=1 Tax=Leisingera TaxID=191028 RepID=UPI001FD1D7CE|nr:MULTISPECIES: OmpA family protein [Leisingera]